MKLWQAIFQRFCRENHFATLFFMLEGGAKCFSFAMGICRENHFATLFFMLEGGAKCFSFAMGICVQDENQLLLPPLQRKHVAPIPGSGM